MKLESVLFGLLLCGCWHQDDREPPSLVPIVPPDTDLCGKMCSHIGPQEKGGLGCEEGSMVFDSDKQRIVSCEEFCIDLQGRGAFLNPRCVMLVPSCDRIEEYRNKDPKTCKE